MSSQAQKSPMHFSQMAATVDTLTQSCTSSKVYQSKPGEASVQRCTYTVHDGALLCVLPDVTVCFTDARFHQTQEAHLSATASIVLLDWYLAGRVANAERWQLARLASTINVHVAGELVLREAVDLAPVANLTLEHSMGAYNVTGVCVLLGPSLEQLVGSVCAQLMSREQYGVEPSRSFVAGCSALRSEGGKLTGCVVRILSTSSQQAYSKLEELLRPLFPIVGGNPFAFKY